MYISDVCFRRLLFARAAIYLIAALVFAKRMIRLLRKCLPQAGSALGAVTVVGAKVVRGWEELPC